MDKPHKHSELIKLWADGAEIESYNICNGWVRCPDPYWSPETNYRIKPKTIKYRNFLWKPRAMSCPDRIVVSVCSYTEDYLEPRENWVGFVQWLGDWQEVEV